MFGLGIGEILVILVVILLVLGPDKMPGIARMLGRGMAEFRRASRDLRETFETELSRPDAQEKAPKRKSPYPAEPKLIDATIEPYKPEPPPKTVAGQPPQAVPTQADALHDSESVEPEKNPPPAG